MIIKLGQQYNKNMLRPYRDLLVGKIHSEIRVAAQIPDPVGIGAVGSSGTRILAQILAESGLVPASPLNPAGDAVEWPPLVDLLAPDMLQQYSQELILNNTYAALEGLLKQRKINLDSSGRSSWKVPTTFSWLESMSQYFPAMPTAA
jgi:hypothetical protein